MYEHSGKSVRYWLLLTERGTGIARRVRMPGGRRCSTPCTRGTRWR
ncbi:hypothetical protein O1L44_00880 [Streptomyces noursei]|nr:hypothetical protein [Streptomyces noursei]